MLVECWASVVDGGPTLNQKWLNVSCLVGMHQAPFSDTPFVILNQYIQRSTNQTLNTQQVIVEGLHHVVRNNIIETQHDSIIYSPFHY